MRRHRIKNLTSPNSPFKCHVQEIGTHDVGCKGTNTQTHMISGTHTYTHTLVPRHVDSANPTWIVLGFSSLFFPLPFLISLSILCVFSRLTRPGPFNPQCSFLPGLLSSPRIPMPMNVHVYAGPTHTPLQGQGVPWGEASGQSNFPVNLGTCKAQVGHFSRVTTPTPGCGLLVP